MSNIKLSSYIKEKALEIGYDLCGITSFDQIEEYASDLNERIWNFPESHALYEKMKPNSNPSASPNSRWQDFPKTLPVLEGNIYKSNVDLT